MKPRADIKYLLKNGEKRTMWWADYPYIYVCKPGASKSIKYDDNGLTIDRSLSDYDIVGLADPPTMERKLPNKSFPKKDKESDSN